ncbi:hypothetical protein G6F42_028635 [Rhizopus arrhizus]|nr:hypothetical protein G6F42_028635 [Rhizopus arrhizus]
MNQFNNNKPPSIQHTYQSQIHPAFQGTKVFRYPTQIPQHHPQQMQPQPQPLPFNASATSPIFYGYSPNPYQQSRL